MICSFWTLNKLLANGVQISQAFVIYSYQAISMFELTVHLFLIDKVSSCYLELN